KRYRESLSASRAKDDRRDAQALTRFILERHRELQPWRPLDAQTRRLNALVEKRRQLVDLRTSITNKLTQALKDTYPQSLELVGRYLYTPLACAFLNKWPTLAELKKARPATISQFYCTHGSRRPDVIAKRLDLIAKAVPLCTDEVVLDTAAELIRAFVKQLQALTASITRFDQRIEEATAAHDDAPLFTSLPGAGPVFAARLLSFFGTDRSVFPDSDSLQRLSGVAPLTKQSGKMHFVHRRYGCNKFWRQTFVEKNRRLVGFLDRSASDEPRRGETPWGGVESMGRSNGYQIPLGEGLLPTAERERPPPSIHPSQPRLQMATHPLQLLEKSRKIRRKALPQSPGKIKQPTPQNHRNNQENPPQTR
ncbi:IS110 family transposase, partial [Roseibacillus ishigakijimensis]|uniref:IS110 family transposase n=1 Tax=Roseibacillus ishigakijimensis TaxID=454146 RepID=UPI003630F28F